MLPIIRPVDANVLVRLLAVAALDLSPDEWHTERLEAREREATGPNGQRTTVTDNVIAVRRLAR